MAPNCGTRVLVGGGGVVGVGVSGGEETGVLVGSRVGGRVGVNAPEVGLVGVGVCVPEAAVPLAALGEGVAVAGLAVGVRAREVVRVGE